MAQQAPELFQNFSSPPPFDFLPFPKKRGRDCHVGGIEMIGEGTKQRGQVITECWKFVSRRNRIRQKQKRPFHLLLTWFIIPKPESLFRTLMSFAFLFFFRSFPPPFRVGFSLTKLKRKMIITEFELLFRIKFFWKTIQKLSRFSDFL